MNTDKVVQRLDGQALTDERGKHITFKELFIIALTANTSKEQSGDEKFTDYQIAQRVSEGLHLSIEDKSRIKTKVGQIFPPLTVGRCWDFLEGKSNGS